MTARARFTSRLRLDRPAPLPRPRRSPWLDRLPRPALVRVRGRSMLPTYREGDVLLVICGLSPRTGRAAVVRLPPDRRGVIRPLAVKRVTGRDPDDASRWWVDSDNPAEGVTSFDVGSLAAADIVAVVVGRVSIRRPHRERR
ncbi:MAG: S24 family peptidase [Dermatophilaceae bacterium]